MNFEFLDHPNVMIDIETLGAIPPMGDCIIPAPFQVGAVRFRPILHRDGTVETITFDELDIIINIESLPDIFEIDGRTVQWHCKQGNVKSVAKAAQPNKSNTDANLVIPQLSDFIKPDHRNRAPFVWAKGLDFDITILRVLAQTTGHDLPWAFWSKKDLRSFKPLPSVRNENSHDGVSDCHQQIEQLRLKLEELS